MTALLLFALQASAVVATARRLERVHGTDAQRTAVRLLVVLVLGVTQVVALGLLLGYTGQLESFRIVLAHVGLLLAVVLATRRSGARPARPLLAQIRRALAGWTQVERRVAAAVAGGLLVFVVTGLVGDPLNHDALSYRLSRIGYWLQEHGVRHFATNELRQSYAPIDGDLLMLWLTHPFAAGYPLVTLAQAVGGALLVLSTWLVAGMAGLRRPAALGAAALSIAPPAVVLQLAGAQNDLLTAGLAWAGLALGLASLEERRLALPAWLAFALAAGTKLTLAYLLPGMALLAVLVLLRRRPGGVSRTLVSRHAACAATCLGLLAAPRYVENWTTFGNALAPRVLYADHQGELAAASVVPKTTLNAATYAAQALDPPSNPAALGPLLDRLWPLVLAHLPEGDPFTGPVYPRRSSLAFFAAEGRRTADTVSLGLVLPLLALLGALSAGWSRFRVRGRDEDALRLGLGAAVVLFFLALSAGFQWWPTNARFFSLVASPLAVLAAAAIAALPARSRPVAWVAVGALAAATAFEAYAGTINAGWRSLPGASHADLPYWGDRLAETRIVNALPARIHLGVALPAHTVLADLFRQDRAVRVQFVPLETIREGDDAAALLATHGLDALLMRPGLPPGTARALLFPAGTDPMVLFLPATPR